MTRKTQIFHLLVTSRVETSPIAATTPAEAQADKHWEAGLSFAGPVLLLAVFLSLGTLANMQGQAFPIAATGLAEVEADVMRHWAQAVSDRERVQLPNLEGLDVGK